MHKSAARLEGVWGSAPRDGGFATIADRARHPRSLHDERHGESSRRLSLVQMPAPG